MTRAHLAALAAVALLGLAACGSDSDGGATASTERAPGAGTEFCSLNADLTNAPSPFSSATATAAEFEKFFTEVVQPGVDQLQAAAPAEIAADMDALAEGYQVLADRFAALGYDPAKASTDTVLSQLGDVQRYNDASTAIKAFCGT